MSKVNSALQRAVRGPLIRWFERHQRDLPWRRDRTPYRVWISELMLQQTRVDQVTPYFERFMERYPDLESFSRARLDQVLKLWEGLGYYARARNAHAAARMITKNMEGRFPDTVEGLLALPGIGPYTAAAIASLAFGRDAAVVDGNVVRVVCRLGAWALDPKSPATHRQVQSVVNDWLPRGRAGLFNEAMMELGATVCLPRGPRCDACPLRSVCGAAKTRDPESFPLRARKARVPHRHVGAGVILDTSGRILIARRKADAMLGGLWEFPGGGFEPGEGPAECIRRELREELGIEVRVGPWLTTVAHAFSHFTMDMHVHWVRIDRGQPRPIGCDSVRWIRIRDLGRYAFPRADQHVIELLRSISEPPRF